MRWKKVLVFRVDEAFLYIFEQGKYFIVFYQNSHLRGCREMFVLNYKLRNKKNLGCLLVHVVSFPFKGALFIQEISTAFLRDMCKYHKKELGTEPSLK